MAQDIFATSPQIDLRKRWALMQLQQATSSEPVRHPLQAVARALQGAMGGYMAGQAEQEDRAAGERWVNSLPGIGTATAMPPTTMPEAPQSAPVVQPDPASAIAKIESGGKYDMLGPVTKTGDRAYGKYQVMGANIPSWTKETLGREMTPQ